LYGNSNENLFIRRYYGATNSNVVFALSSFLSVDDTRSRRCSKHSSKVVVVIYVVEYKICVVTHYIRHFICEITKYIVSIRTDSENIEVCMRMIKIEPCLQYA
jgi:hypothetical protein